MKKFSRKLLSLLLVAIMALTSTGLSTLISAAVLDIKDGSTQKLYVSWYSYNYNFGGRLNTNTYGQIIKLNVGSTTGQVAYCIQSSKDAYTSDYTASEYYSGLTDAQKKHIKHALIYSYQGATKYGATADVERIASQIIIWNICDGWFNNSSESTALTVFTEDMSSSTASAVKTVYNKIKSQMLSHLTIPSFAVAKNITPTAKTMKLGTDGNYYLTLSDSKGVSSYYDWATAIKNAEMSSYLTITTNTNGNLTLKSTKAITSDKVLLAQRTKNTYQNSIVDVAPMFLMSNSSQEGVTFVPDKDPSEAKISLQTEAVGNISITKSYDPAGSSTLTTAEKTALYGKVQFTIKNSAGQFVKKGGNKTDGYYYAGTSSSDLGSNTATRFYLNTSTGKQTISSLPTGTYTITEVVCNTGYTAAAKTKTITVSQSATTTAAFTNNENVGNLNIAKTYSQTDTLTTTEKGNLMWSVQFTIKNSKGEYVKKTGSRYAGYSYAGTQATDDSSTRFWLNITTGSTLDTLSATKVNNNGIQAIANLPVGTYTITEIASNTNYTAIATTKTITVSKGGNITSTFTNKQDVGNITIAKTYSQTDTLTTAEKGKLMWSVQFRIKNAAGEYVKKTGSRYNGYTYAGTQATDDSSTRFWLNITTGSSFDTLSATKVNNNGIQTIKGLPIGTYTVEEVVGNTGYTANGTTSKVTVSNGKTSATTYTNTQDTGSLTLAKIFRNTNRTKITPNVAQLAADATMEEKYYEVDGYKYAYSAYYMYFYVQDEDGNYVAHSGNRTDGYSYKGITTDCTSANGNFFYLNVTNPSSLKMVISDLPVGKYYITEHIGYCDKATKTIFNFSAESDTVTIAKNVNKSYTKYNDQDVTYNGNIKIVKTFFDITGTGREDVTATTTAKSLVRFKLSYVEDGEKVYCSFKKTANGIYKYSGVSSAGTEMLLAADGTIKISGLPNYAAAGITYTAEETTNNSPYKLNNAQSTFSVKIPQNDDTTKTITIVNEVELGTLKINKILKNADGTTVPSGSIFATIKFKVADKSGKWLTFDSTNTYTGTTDSEANATPLKLTATTTSITLYKLPYGSYAVYEVEGAVGYSFDSEDEEIATIDSVNTVPVTFTNQQETGELLIEKVFEDIDGTNIVEIEDLATEIEFVITVGTKYVTATSNAKGSYKYAKLTTDRAAATTFKLDIDGTIALRNCPPATYNVTETKGAGGFAYSTVAKGINVLANQQNKTVFTNKAMAGNIKVVKTSTNNVIEGFSFRIFGTALTGEEYDKTFVTDSKGEINITNLRIGIYTVSEVINDKTVGYITPDNKTVEVEYNKTTNVGMGNKRITGNVTITKIDKDYPDTKLIGAEFTVYVDKNGNGLYDSATDTVYGKLTGSNGVYTLKNIDYGTYLIKETKAPTGFNQDTKFYPFAIENDGETIEITNTDIGKGYENDAMTGNIKVIKTSTNNVIKGFSFRVTGTAVTGQTYDETFVTDENGEIHITGLRIGTYKVAEVLNRATVGYITPTAKDVVVEKDVTTEVGMGNKRITGSVEVIKVDKEYQNKKLSGAEFTVYVDKNGNGLYDSATDTVYGKLTETDGVYTMTGIDYGTYLLKETKSPNGYIQNETYYPFAIVADNVKVRIETTAGDNFENAPMSQTARAR